jgi:hypothetical protein
MAYEITRHLRGELGLTRLALLRLYVDVELSEAEAVRNILCGQDQKNRLALLDRDLVRLE